jgi:hypothetical protein
MAQGAGGGRPDKYPTHIAPYLDRIPKLKRQGLTDKQIADKLGVGITTLKDAKIKYPALAAALKTGRMELVEDLEDTLYRKALGKVKIKKIKKYVEEVDGKRTTRIEETEEELAPDTGALVFALKNLDPDNWKDTRHLEGGDQSKAEIIGEISGLIETIKGEK